MADPTSADRRTRSGWPVVLGYAAVAGSSQLLWLTYAPITTAAARHYDVSVTAIGWLANVFPLLYVVLAVPAGLALDRSPRSALGLGVVLTATGGLVRLVGDDYGWVLAGQLLVAVAQPLVLNAITGVVSVLPLRSRATGLAVGSGGLFLGMVVALASGAVAGGDHLTALLRWQAAVGVLAAAGFLLAAARSPRPPEPTELAAGGELRRVWTDPVLRRVAALAFLGFGVFIALTTWLQALLEPRGLSESAAGALIAAAVAVGAVGSMLVTVLLEERAARVGGVEVPLLRVTLVGAVLGCLLLAVASGLAGSAVGTVVTVLAMLTALPWLLAICERRAVGSVASATAVVWLAGNLGGLVVAVAVGALVDHPVPAFLLLAAVALVGLPLVSARLLAPAEPADRQVV